MFLNIKISGQSVKLEDKDRFYLWVRFKSMEHLSQNDNDFSVDLWLVGPDPMGEVGCAWEPGWCDGRSRC